MKRVPRLFLVACMFSAFAFGALCAACAGANGDPAPILPEAGSDAATVIVACDDAGAG